MSTKSELDRIKEITGCTSFTELLEGLEDVKDFLEDDFGYNIDEEYNLIDAIYSFLMNCKFDQDLQEYNKRHID